MTPLHTIRPPMSDAELAEKIAAMDVRKLYAGCVVLGHKDSTRPFLKRLYAMTREIVGDKEAAAIEGRVRQSALDLRISGRKTPERMGRSGVANKQQAGKASHIGLTCQERQS